MKIVRIYTGQDQRSHFEEVELSFSGDPPILTADPKAASRTVFRYAPPGAVIGRHPAPRRQYVVTLSGQWDIELGDGTVRRFKTGDVLLAEDLTGEGHISRVVGDEPHIFMTVHLAE